MKKKLKLIATIAFSVIITGCGSSITHTELEETVKLSVCQAIAETTNIANSKVTDIKLSEEANENDVYKGKVYLKRGTREKSKSIEVSYDGGDTAKWTVGGLDERTFDIEELLALSKRIPELKKKVQVNTSLIKTAVVTYLVDNPDINQYQVMLSHLIKYLEEDYNSAEKLKIDEFKIKVIHGEASYPELKFLDLY